MFMIIWGKVVGLFELVQIYDHNKLFFLINLRSYLSDGEMEEFFEDVQNRGYIRFYS